MAYAPQKEDTHHRSRRREDDGYRSGLTPGNLDRIVAKGQSSTDLNLTKWQGPFGFRSPSPGRGGTAPEKARPSLHGSGARLPPRPERDLHARPGGGNLARTKLESFRGREKRWIRLAWTGVGASSTYHPVRVRGKDDLGLRCPQRDRHARNEGLWPLEPSNVCARRECPFPIIYSPTSHRI